MAPVAFGLGQQTGHGQTNRCRKRQNGQRGPHVQCPIGGARLNPAECLNASYSAKHPPHWARLVGRQARRKHLAIHALVEFPVASLQGSWCRNGNRHRAAGRPSLVLRSDPATVSSSAAPFDDALEVGRELRVESAQAFEVLTGPRHVALLHEQHAAVHVGLGQSRLQGRWHGRSAPATPRSSVVPASAARRPGCCGLRRAARRVRAQPRTSAAHR